MKSVFYFLIMAFWAVPMAFCQTGPKNGSSPAGFEETELEQEILGRFEVAPETYEGKVYYSFQIIKEKPGDGLLTRICNRFLGDNYFYVDFLTMPMMPAFFKESPAPENETPEGMGNRFRNFMRENKNVTAEVCDFFASYVKSKGHQVGNGKAAAKKKCSLERLKSYAVRNVVPFEIGEDGQVLSKMCVAGEGFEDFPEDEIHLKAFTFSAVFSHKDSEAFGKMLNRAKAAVRALRLSADPDTALKRAQGVFWAMMLQDKNFEKMLVSCYKEKKEYLPFELVFE